MPEIKNNFLRGVMNKDLDERLVPNGQYIDALNVEVTTSEDGGTISNIKGNLRVDNLPLYSEQEYICVGSIVDEKNNSIYWFISGRTIDAIAEFNVDTEETTMVAVDELKQTDKAFLKFSKKKYNRYQYY